MQQSESTQPTAAAACSICETDAKHLTTAAPKSTYPPAVSRTSPKPHHDQVHGPAAVGILDLVFFEPGLHQSRQIHATASQGHERARGSVSTGAMVTQGRRGPYQDQGCLAKQPLLAPRQRRRIEARRNELTPLPTPWSRACPPLLTRHARSTQQGHMGVMRAKQVAATLGPQRRASEGESIPAEPAEHRDKPGAALAPEIKGRRTPTGRQNAAVAQ